MIDTKGINFEEIIAGLDVGYRDDNAFITLGFKDGCYYVIDEYISKEVVTSELAAEILEREEQFDTDTIYIDSSAAQAKADFAYEYDITCTNAIKSVLDGITFVQSLIERDALYFDIDNGFQTFRAMSAYMWNPKTEQPKPIHNWASHPCDAVRYAVYTHNKHSSVDIYT